MELNDKLFDHYLWNEKRSFSRFEAWLYLLKESDHYHTDILDRGRLVELRRGEIYTSCRELASIFGWSVGKTIRFLHLLESDKMISSMKLYATKKTILTIIDNNTAKEAYNSISINENVENIIRGKKRENE